jgi:hypothetical protein
MIYFAGLDGKDFINEVKIYMYSEWKRDNTKTHSSKMTASSSSKVCTISRLTKRTERLNIQNDC